MHHSVSARTIRRRLQQSGLSASCPMLGLPLTQNHRRLHHQWCDERRMWVEEENEVAFTDEPRICLQHHDVRIRNWRHRGERMLNSCVMHRHTGPAPGIMVRGGIGYHSRTPLVRIAGTLNSPRYISEVLEPVDLPYLQGLATAIFQQDNARPHVARIFQRFFVNHHIELLPSPARSPNLSPIENMWSMVAQRLTQITPPAATPDQLWQPTRGLLATDHVILNHGQVTWTTPELAPPLLTTTPQQRENVSTLNRFKVHHCPTRRVFSGTGLEPVTKQATVRYLYHLSTAADIIAEL
ncbi:transposable element Tcb1 transposase [Trichonephila clavipes]|nr:transposable element Tcb1 transposase [Trichonephila clavipes]